MTDRWQNQRAEQTPDSVSGSDGPSFGWSTPSGQTDMPPAADAGRARIRPIIRRLQPAPRIADSKPAPVPTTDENPHVSQAVDIDSPARPEPVQEETLPDQSDAAPTEPAWPGAGHAGSDELYRRLPHALVMMVAIAMVLGGGFWQRDQDQSIVMPGGTDNIQQISTSPFPDPNEQRQHAISTQGLIASIAENPMGGYLSTSSVSVTPQHLGIETYITREGQSISSVAMDTGRAEETLLWANDYRDSSQELPSGTQLRIPPEDGMLHIVSDGDTLENIAQRYEVSPEAITSYEPNGIEHSADLVTNRMIMVPGGTMPMRGEVIVYTVREGDQLWQVADRFGLRAQTILWANSLSSSDDIRPGQQLAILPTDGVMVQVEPEDTVDSLAEAHGVSSSAIRDWPANGLGADGSLVAGQSVMIPGGTPAIPPEPEPTPTPEPTPEMTPEPEEADDEELEETDDFRTEPPRSSPPAPSEPSGASPYGTGEFIWPTTGVITQYFHSSHNGWDIANRIGTEIWAADNGRVIFSGWNSHGLGYAVAIDHGNGYQSWYGHMDEHPPVEVGQAVGQGEFIGPMGSTGFSTGPHVHFVIAYNGAYQDPGNYLR